MCRPGSAWASSAAPCWSWERSPSTCSGSGTRSADSKTMTADELRSLIASGLPCDHVEVAGDGRHWQAVIVSAEFAGLRPIQRHQRVYATLGARMHTDEVHALSMKTFTPAEWQANPTEGPWTSS